MFFSVCFCDAAVPWQFGIQDPATPVAEGIIRFHHDLIFIIIFVVVFVSWMLFRLLMQFNSVTNPTPSHVVHGTVIEIVWTIIPALLLIIIAVPSWIIAGSW